MRTVGLVCALLAAGLALAACRDADKEHHASTVLGGASPETQRVPSSPKLTDASGQAVPAPPAPANSAPRMALSGGDGALAVWVQGGDVLASAWTRAGGWTAAQLLERLHGESRDPQLASNGQGAAMAVWHHQVGNIHSLRFSRFEAATGWSVPDVLPGALPKPAVAGMAPGQNAPRLEMDAEGKVLARWPSGLRANAFQDARHVPGQGWETPNSEPVASAPLTSAGPAPAPER
ncbi:MAG TPA: hypothetical protein VFB71_12550 [Ramlibacter sp.]|nr:hypothetical protein [Ramlibacter sp.]